MAPRLPAYRLRPELAASIAVSRFLKEIEIAAQLNAHSAMLILASTIASAVCSLRTMNASSGGRSSFNAISDSQLPEPRVYPW